MKLYLKYISIHFRCAMQYKTSFLLTITGQLLTSVSVFIGIAFMFSRFNTVEGFTFNEVLLCFAVIVMSHAITESVTRGFGVFQSTISNGEFDRIMVRPRHEMFQVLAGKFEFSRMGLFLEAAAVFCYAIPMSGIIWTPLKVLTLIFMVLGGTALFSGLFIIFAAFCFFTTEGLEFMNIFIYGGREFGSYPMSVYGAKVLGFFTFVVPLACVQYYPLLYLLGRTTNAIYMFAPFCSFIFLAPCYLFWRFGVRHYKSTGS